jgi:primosomal protein N' (replication factor Y)
MADTPAIMYLVRIIPITKEPIKGELSYFSKRKLSIGTVALISVRNREMFGLVAACDSALDQKAALKNAPFTMKKIESIKEGTFFDEPFLRAAEKTARHFAIPFGALLRVHIPEPVLESWDGLITETDQNSSTPKNIPPTPGTKTINTGETLLLQVTEVERESTYRAMIREEFAKRASIMVIVPNKAVLKKLSETISKGIEEYTLCLSSELSKKELVATWKRALETKHSVLIIATPQFLSLPRTDIGTYVVEYENSPGYKSHFRPYFDARVLASYLARERGATIVFADTLLSVQTLAKKEDRTAQPLVPLKHRLTSFGETAIIDLKTRPHEKKGDYFLSDELLSLIKNTLARNQRVFLFTARKGIAPLTICSDCGTTLTCPTCSRPLVLHAQVYQDSRGDIKNVFICHSCAKEYPSDVRCKICGGWRLAPLGVGVEKVGNALLELFPETPLFSIDSDSIKTHKKAEETVREFLSHDSAILIGTEMALPYLPRLDVSGVVSIDNLFAIPDFRMNERLMHFFVSIREKTDGAMIIQTRKPEMRIFWHAARGTLLDFFREEMESRKKYLYPPHALFIKITREGPSAEVNADMDALGETLAHWKPDIFSGLHIPGPGEETIHALIRLSPEKWPDEALLEQLTMLPQSFSIRVDPDGLL